MARPPRTLKAHGPCAHGDEMTAPEVDPSMDMGGMGPLSHPQHVGDAHSNGERVADVAKIASPRFTHQQGICDAINDSASIAVLLRHRVARGTSCRTWSQDICRRYRRGCADVRA